VAADDDAILTPGKNGLDESELAQAALEGVEFFLADPAGVRWIGVELVDRNELDDMGARFHAPQSERR
jgi:hypothetical protein